MNGDGFKCNNKETEEKGQLVYTIKLLCCIKSGVILRKFQWCIVFAYGYIEKGCFGNWSSVIGHWGFRHIEQCNDLLE